MPRFGITTQAAWIVVAAGTGLTWSILTLLIRVFLRLKINGPWGWDDTTCTIATCLAVVQSTTTLLQIRFGSGQHVALLSQSTIEINRFVVWIGTLLWITTIAFSMLSIAFLMARITQHRKHCYFAHAIALTTATWATSYIFIMAFRCKLPTPWLTATRGCLDQNTIWLSFVVSKACLESSILILAIILLSSLQMRLKFKVMVAVAFSIRLLTIPPSVIRLQFLNAAIYGQDWTFSRTGVAIISQIELHLSVILATLPCVKPWLAMFGGGAFDMHMPDECSRDTSRDMSSGEARGATNHNVYMHHAQEHKQSHERHRSSVEKWHDHVTATRPDQSRTVTTITHDPEDAREAARRRSIESSGSSTKHIMRMDSFSVHFATATGTEVPIDQIEQEGYFTKQ